MSKADLEDVCVHLSAPPEKKQHTNTRSLESPLNNVDFKRGNLCQPLVSAESYLHVTPPPPSSCVPQRCLCPCPSIVAWTTGGIVNLFNGAAISVPAGWA